MISGLFASKVYTLSTLQMPLRKIDSELPTITYSFASFSGTETGRITHATCNAQASPMVYYIGLPISLTLVFFLQILYGNSVCTRVPDRTIVSELRMVNRCPSCTHCSASMSPGFFSSFVKI